MSERSLYEQLCDEHLTDPLAELAPPEDVDPDTMPPEDRHHHGEAQR